MHKLIDMGKKKEQIPFYVLNENFYRRGTFAPYDVMPYLVERYKETKKSKHKTTPQTFDEFKQFVKDNSLYQYWGRCEYEFLMGTWPFGTKKMTEEIVEFAKGGIDTEDWKKKIDLCNIVTKDMQKIDVYEQIMMNHDTVTKILMENVL